MLLLKAMNNLEVILGFSLCSSASNEGKQVVVLAYWAPQLHSIIILIIIMFCTDDQVQAWIQLLLSRISYINESFPD
jgi:hypothetical protein